MNVWECDTKLDDLVKKKKYESEEELGIDGDELANNKNGFNQNDDDLEVKEENETNKDNMDIDDDDDDDDEDKKITIHYKKVAKYK